MDEKEAARTAVREFLSSRRDRVSPADAGLPSTARRRVKGLRREEVALLAGISPEYYIRLERGRATGPSPGVVESIAAVLRLDDDERAHLDRLLTALTPEARKRRTTAATAATISPGIRVLLDSIDHLPAVVFNRRLDLLAANDLGRALYATMLDTDSPVNAARFLFLDVHAARGLFPEWERIAGDTVSILRTEAGRHPDDPELVALIGQLSTRSHAFRTRWAANDVKTHRAGTKVFQHPLIGTLILPFENLTIDTAADQVMTVFTPQPGSPEHDAIRLLASWNAPASDLTAADLDQPDR